MRLSSEDTRSGISPVLFVFGSMRLLIVRLVSDSRPVSPGIVRTPRRPSGWVPPGPRPRGSLGRIDLAPGEDEDLCCLSGDWRIFQQQRGNRWSLDDLVTACIAARSLEGGEPSRALDMGCGIGSVLMMIAWRFPRARVSGVEAQALSVGLAKRSLAWNGADDRCDVRLGDLRDPDAFDTPRAFDLVTGTPPYFPRGEGLESDHPQCAPCRFEHRGGVEAYASAAARWLAPKGRFVMCAAAGEADRVKAGARDAGLDLLAWLDVVPREGKASLVAVFTLAHAAGAPSPRAASRLVVRDRAGAWTPEFISVRLEMGLPPPLAR